ncbi:MAG: RelA/SpoT family protein [Muribaculaceae bacterium]|nr:RelA/SpoT family protein [Muribaculaceae bacterium]
MEKATNLTLPLLVRKLVGLSADVAATGDYGKLKDIYRQAAERGASLPPRHGIDPTVQSLNAAIALCEMVSPDRNMILAVMLYQLAAAGAVSTERIAADWDPDVAHLVSGLIKVSSLYGKQTVVKTDNFRRLLMALADDIRVIIIMIVERLTLMRAINHHPDEKFVTDTAFEANYLYAPLAHRLGLYKIKSELEDLSLKYTSRDTYTRIARGLNETKAERDAYITSFITPLREKLDHTGLKYEIKGRTKSIYSIWNKLRKQQVDLSGVYDLFAIRIILDVEPEREKAECWRVFSIVTDMYTSNPKRLRDWITIPKSNGYESLHTTVMGPEGKWVEVQIRTHRMDLVAEKGLAAHWRYKGIKSESSLDQWMNNVRDILETAEGPMELMKNFKMDLYDKEVFVFTPQGDLHRLPLGATVLDFAFAIHSKLGCACIGGKVNGRNRKLGHKLRSGDTVEILTSPSQTPKQDWLNIVVTGKARTKIRQTINERAARSSEYGKELLQRRCKNRKIELDEGILMRTIKKMGYKTVTDFYKSLADETIDPADVIAGYEAIQAADAKAALQPERRSAEEFELADPTQKMEEATKNDDVLVIGTDNIRGMNYRMARCCNPIFGDKVFGFISSEGVVKIHREDCPNSAHIHERYPYRVIRTRWSGKTGNQTAATIRIVGNDDIGIVTNITSVINKEKDVLLRNISIESHDGIFSGFLVVGVNDTEALNNVIKKIQAVKGVKNVQRSN